LDAVARADLLSERGRLAIDRDPPGEDQLLDLPPRRDPRLGEHLLQPLRLGKGLRLRPAATAGARASPLLAGRRAAERRLMCIGPPQRFVLAALARTRSARRGAALVARPGLTP